MKQQPGDDLVSVEIPAGIREEDKPRKVGSLGKDQTKRLMELEGLLMTAPYSREQLSRVLCVSQDTIRRDIKLLKELGSDAEYSDAGGWFALRPVFVKNMRKKS